MKSTTLMLTLACALAGQSLGAAAAQATMDHSKMGHAAVAMTDGEVTKIDQKTQTITLKHGPIANLDMPAMTMAFKVKSPALLAKVKAGDKVRFTAEMPGGTLTLAAIELAK